MAFLNNFIKKFLKFLREILVIIINLIDLMLYL